MKKASDIFIEALVAEGVTHVFGVPGEENLDFLDSLQKSDIKLILTRNEQTAVFMAANFGRFTGSPGVALSTLGPGATNLMTGVGYAQLNGLPVIVITGQKPIKKSKQGEFQVIDVVAMMRPLTKFAKQIPSADRVPSLVRHAFKVAVTERPGVVHLELPEDIARDMTTASVVPPTSVRRPVVEDKAYQSLVDVLHAAKQPVVLIGAGANRKRVTKYLTQFIKTYNIPFFTSQMGKGVIDERLTQYLGTAAVSDGDDVHTLVSQADVIIAVGHDTIEKPANFISDSNRTQKLVHVNFYEATIDDVYAPDLEVIGDIGNLFWRLCDGKYEFAWRHNALAQEKKELTGTQHEENITPDMLITTLRDSLADGDVVALDNGWYKLWFARNYKTYAPNTLLLDNTFATMGAGLASGMVAKYLHPEKNVVVVTGDGGLLMNLGDLETAVRLGLNLTVIVLNNQAYGMIKEKQKAMGLTEFGLDFTNPDFPKLAESFGATGLRIANASSLSSICKEALDTRGVTLVEVPIFYPQLFTEDH